MPRRETPTVAQAVAQYQETREPRVAATTLANDWSLLRNFTRAMGPDKQVHTLTQRKVEQWFATEAKRQRASSYNKVRTRVKGFIEFSRRRGWVTHDLLAEVGTIRVPKRERMKLSPVELVDLPSHTDSARDHAFVVLACNTALRANEIVGLRVRDVDLGTGSLHVTVTKSAIEDQMPISMELDVELRQWFKLYATDAGPLQPDWHLFPQRKPGAGRYIKSESLGTTYVGHVYGELLPEKSLRNPAEIVQRVLRAQGHTLTPGEGVHTIRRSVARAYFDARVNAGYDGALRETSALLHHSSSQVTEQYLSLSTEKLGRDRAMKGKPFLTSMIDPENVTPIRLTSV